MQVEDRCSNFLDHGLQLIDDVVHARPHLRRRDGLVGALQRQAGGEQSLDDVVVKIPRDPIAVCDHVEFAHPALGVGQLPGQCRLVGECRHHVQLVVAEVRLTRSTQHYHYADDGLGGSQR